MEAAGLTAAPEPAGARARAQRFSIAAFCAFLRRAPTGEFVTSTSPDKTLYGRPSANWRVNRMSTLRTNVHTAPLIDGHPPPKFQMSKQVLFPMSAPTHRRKRPAARPASRRISVAAHRLDQSASGPATYARAPQTVVHAAPPKFQMFKQVLFPVPASTRRRERPAAHPTSLEPRRRGIR